MLKWMHSIVLNGVIKGPPLDVYIARSGWRNSRPCRYCRKFLRQMKKRYNIGRIIYTQDIDGQKGIIITDINNI